MPAITTPTWLPSAEPPRGPRTTSVIVNPLASIVIGVTAFGERLRPGPGFVALDVLALMIMCAGVVILIRSPLVGGLGGTRSDEYLAADPVPGVHKERTKFRRTEPGTTYTSPDR
jgi:hypothetical protein